jgi:Rrf2 family iron-sulfur cluster assembly transcriptional regulator
LSESPIRVDARWKGDPAAVAAGMDDRPGWTGTVTGDDDVKLSTKGRYAVMAMVDLSNHSQGSPVALADIADRQEISLSYLEQLFGKLRKGGLVKSVRGPGGGYLLSRPAEQLRISDIILAVDEPIQTTRCSPGTPAGCHHNKGRCLTHDLWEELGNQIYLYLSSVSLADVVERRVLGTSGMFHGTGSGGGIAAAE